MKISEKPVSRITYHFLLVLTLLFTCHGLALADAPVNTLEKALFGYKPNGIAIRGYDTVAYFTESKPVEGDSAYSTEWMGATWHFASQENLTTFTENPERYAPQYGGYCAYGVAQGYLVKVEPDQWSIVDDKLYLNFDNSVQKKWVKDIPGYIATADGNIAGLLAK
ncbi:MAG: YHS domain-containing (seleno)protein [Granulosicoccus sp.]